MNSTRLMAALLSVSQRRRHLCRKPQNFAREEHKRSGAVSPPSSLLVEFAMSRGPSTGPDPSNRVVLAPVVLSLVSIFQPKVPIPFLRPPSDAMVIRCFERKARHTSKSVATCLKTTRSLRCHVGRD